MSQCEYTSRMVLLLCRAWNFAKRSVEDVLNFIRKQVESEIEQFQVYPGLFRQSFQGQDVFHAKISNNIQKRS